MLMIEAVSRRYPTGITALEAISLRVEEGDFVVLLGPSGCGKSTLLRLVAGLDSPDAGRISWDEGAPPAGRIGYVFQDATLLPWATVLQNAALPLRLHGEDTTQVTPLLARLGLAAFASARPSQLSGGMRMRVSIARALAIRPRLLLMDEPFAALDEFTRQGLQDELRSLAAETRCTVLFVTHSIYEAAFLARRAILLSPRPGRIVQAFNFAAPVRDRLDPEFAARLQTLGVAAAQLAAQSGSPEPC